ncbi:IS66 family insertion sequence element accessory protein TnpB [Bariatricus sp. SGI.154]|uniref:IS66 family insertion sequence element accessory protein TnpB n=1 Tax=Bariatricus sp. SGI.154 TaxID=3420549 RepID=UPI003CFEA20A
MDQCTHEVRAEYWKGVIKACGQRPAGQSAKSWMDENGICEQSYYHWQRKFRQKAYEEMKENCDAVPAVAGNTELSFVEIPYCASPVKNEQMISGGPVAVIRTSALKIEITNDISDSLLSRIIREVSHA